MKAALTWKLPAAAAIVAALASGCVTRTVYVVDDRDRAPAARRADPEPEPERVVVSQRAYENDVGIVDDSDFYEPLSPYGTWVAYPGYGRVWRPSVTVVGNNFRPYTHGHWEHTEWGWTWVDHHPFGWATGHYGRWLYDSSYGWVWVPGTTWSPAWVTWRTGGGYVGWAAMPPGSVYGGSYAVYETSWVFVQTGSMGVAYVGGVIVTGPAYRTCYASTYDSRTTYRVYGRDYYQGPDYDEVRRSGRVIHRPLAETERERPVSRPPSGTVIARGRDRDRDPTRGHDGEERGRPRDRDDNDTRGNGRDRDDNNGRDRDDNNGNGRDRPNDRDDNNDRPRNPGDRYPDSGKGNGRDDRDPVNGGGRDDDRTPDRGNDRPGDRYPDSGKGNGRDRPGNDRPSDRPTERDDDHLGSKYVGDDTRVTPAPVERPDDVRADPPRGRDRTPVNGGRDDDARTPVVVDNNDRDRPSVGRPGTDRDTDSTRLYPTPDKPRKTLVDDPNRFKDNTRVGGGGAPQIDRTPSPRPGRPTERAPDRSADRTPDRTPDKSPPPRVEKSQPEPEQAPTSTSKKKKDDKKSSSTTTTKKKSR